MRRRPKKSRILLPGERESRRGFLKKGLLGGLLLVAGGGGYLATRKTKPLPGSKDRFHVFSPEEAAVILAVAERLVPEREGFPRPAGIDIAGKVDALAYRMFPSTQKELKQLVRLFESALAGFLFEGVPRTFTDSSFQAQGRRLAGWAHSRFALRRTGFQTLRRLVYSAYYASPEVYSALGYPGPPSVDQIRKDSAKRKLAEEKPPEAKPERKPRRRPKPVEPAVETGETRPATDGTTSKEGPPTESTGPKDSGGDAAEATPVAPPSPQEEP
jgi:hypothetical protein